MDCIAHRSLSLCSPLFGLVRKNFFMLVRFDVSTAVTMKDTVLFPGNLMVCISAKKLILEKLKYETKKYKFKEKLKIV
jgi:hypothetical protein